MTESANLAVGGGVAGIEIAFRGENHAAVFANCDGECLVVGGVGPGSAEDDVKDDGASVVSG